MGMSLMSCSSSLMALVWRAAVSPSLLKPVSMVLKMPSNRRLWWGVNQAVKGRQGIAHMRHIKVALVRDPGRKQVLVGDEVADVALDMVNGFKVVF